MILPAALRQAALVEGVEALSSEIKPLIDELVEAIFALEKANDHEGPDGGLVHARYMRDTVIPAMNGVRKVADKLERIVADDLWPLPKYEEMLFIK